MQGPADRRLVSLVKFADLPDAADGSRYETWAVDPHWIYHLEDASGDDTYHFTDPRWFPRVMPIGEAHAFVTGDHALVRYARGTCLLIARHGFARKMWLVGIVDDCYWGPDLGWRATAVLAYDASGGHHVADRAVELYFCAWGIGPVRWDSYRSDLVYAHGPAVFPDAARTMRSDFYLLGGPTPPFGPTGCVELVVPSYPPWEEKEPPPPPPPPQEPVMRIQLSVPAYLNWRWGGGQSLDPPTNPDDTNRQPFEFGRRVAEGDETCELVPVGEEYAVRSPNGRSWLSVQPDGSLQERDARGEPGPWERFSLVDGVLIEKAKEGVTRPPVEFLP